MYYSTKEWEEIRKNRREILGKEFFSLYLKSASGMYQVSLKKNSKRIYNSFRKFKECLRMMKGEDPKVYLTGNYLFYLFFIF